MEMKDRIAKIIKKEQLTSQQFAEIIEIQSSTISHILAGRNLPSFKIIYNLLEKFPKINPDWLIFGTGEMYRSENKDLIDNSNTQSESGSIFDISDILDGRSEISPEIAPILDNKEASFTKVSEETVILSLDAEDEPSPVMDSENEIEVNRELNHPKTVESTISLNDSRIKKILVIYEDNTFETLNPR